MPVQLLPASAAAFLPRADSVNVVLGSKTEAWLTQVLKRVNRVKRPLNNVAQHTRCLSELLSSKNAIWNLASLMLPKSPESELSTNPDPLVEAILDHQMLHISAFVVHVDMVLRNEVAFKLTPETIEALVEHHKDVHCVDAKATTYDWSEKDQHIAKLHDNFVQAINKFVFRTHVSALEGMEEEGAGELLCGKSEEVKNAITGLFKPLLPPPPRIVDVVRQQPPLLPSNQTSANFWPHPMSQPMSQPMSAHSPLSASIDPWQVLPSSPDVTSSVDSASIWANMSMSEAQIPSPPQSFSQPFSSADFFYSSMSMAPIPTLPLPSMLTPCALSAGGFGWDRYPYQPGYATTM